MSRYILRMRKPKPKPDGPTTAQLRSAFAKTVHELRLKAGLTQEEMAHELKIDRGNLAKAERSKHTPTIGTVVRLLPGLRVTVAQFFTEFERNLRDQR
jgi:transcriptional regulator with XRE-family HTH domain